MNFETYEDTDGVRLPFNALPAAVKDADGLVLPISLLHKPLSVSETMPVANYEPVLCKNGACKGVLNPYCLLDLSSKYWTCRLCLVRNPLPAPYHEISPDNLPAELLPSSSSIEYILARPVKSPPVFFFLVDTCLDAENLQALKDALLVALGVLPQSALVGLLTFGTHVQVHDLSAAECKRSVVFNGAKSYAPKQVHTALGLMATDARVRKKNTAIHESASRKLVARYFLPVAEAEFELTNILEALSADSFAVKSHDRALRASGNALDIAQSIVENAFPSSAVRTMLFLGGPCTTGPGTIVGQALREPIRSHHDIENGSAKHHKAALKYYKELAARAAKNGNIVDLLAACYDQVGLEEMRSIPGETGGAIVLSDAFTTSIFKQSFLRIFAKDERDGQSLRMAFNASYEVKCSNELRSAGMIGYGAASEKTALVAEKLKVGIAGTNHWKIAGVSPQTTFALFFELTPAAAASAHGNAHATAALNQQPTVPLVYVQLLTHYQHASGTNRLRVTTIARRIVGPGEANLINSAFDQEAAVTVMARMALDKLDKNEAVADVIRWIDSTLVQICTRFGEYNKASPQSFRISSEFTMVPQFVYHLRRCGLVQMFNNSPDETAFYRHVFMGEDVTNSTIMIQPTLTSYAIDQEPEPVLLDSVSVKPDTILLLDTFFHILIYHGQTIAEWRRQGYQDQEEYANFKALLEQPRQDATEVLVDRFPLPRFIDTAAGGSQARFLMSRLNPSRDATGSTSNLQVLTDDISLQGFMEHLVKLVVNGK